MIKTVTHIKSECLKCPCFKVQNCLECEDFTIALDGSLAMCHGYSEYCNRDDCVIAHKERTQLQREKAFDLVRYELENAVQNHRIFASPHEGYAIIKEELDELWAEIKKREPNLDRLRKEAIQVATMGLCFVLDLCPPDVTEEVKQMLEEREGSA